MTSLRPGVVAIGEHGKHTRLFIRGGFADVSAAGLIVLAETAIPVDELNAERIDAEIKNAEEDLADASDDQKRAAQEKLDRLRELKDALKIEGVCLASSGRPRRRPPPQRGEGLAEPLA